MLHRYLSNEQIPTISEESPCYPLPYRPRGERHLVRGVDHIRGSQCLVDADLHTSATIPYQEAIARKPSASKSSKRPPSEPSLLSSWIARLKLLTHWLCCCLPSLCSIIILNLRLEICENSVWPVLQTSTVYRLLLLFKISTAFNTRLLRTVSLCFFVKKWFRSLIDFSVGSLNDCDIKLFHLCTWSSLFSCLLNSFNSHMLTVWGIKTVIKSLKLFF